MDSREESRCIIHCTDDNTKLVTLTSLASWKTLLSAAQIRGHSAILAIANDVEEGEYPLIEYHRNCRSKFTLKKKLQLIAKKSTSTLVLDNPTSSHTDPTVSEIRQSRSKNPTTAQASSALLPQLCIFCNKYSNCLKCLNWV